MAETPSFLAEDDNESEQEYYLEFRNRITWRKQWERAAMNVHEFLLIIIL